MNTAGTSRNHARRATVLAALFSTAVAQPVAGATSIDLSATSGYPGSAVTVSGQTRAGAAGVRLLRNDGRTASGAADAAVDRLGNYQHRIVIPADMAPGPIRLCAFERGPGALGDDMACRDFTVVLPPPGSISGIVRDRVGNPLAGVTVRLSDGVGVPQAVATTDPNGHYTFAGLPPGPWKLRAFKEGFPGFGETTVVVQPGEGADGSFGEEDPLGDVYLKDSGAVATLVSPPYQPVETTLGTFLYPFGPFAFDGIGTDTPITWVRFYVDLGQEIPGATVRFDFHDGWGNWATFGTVVEGSPRYGFPAYWVDRRVDLMQPGHYTVDAVIEGFGNPRVLSTVFDLNVYDLTARWLNPWVGNRTYTVFAYPTSLTYRLQADLPADPTVWYPQNIDLGIHTFANSIYANVGFAEDQHVGTPGFEGLGAFVPGLRTQVTLLDSALVDDTYLYQPVDGSNGLEYVIPPFTAASSAQFVYVRLYQNGPGIVCIPACLIDCDACFGYKIWVDFAMGGSVDLASTIRSDLSVDVAVTPAVYGALGGHFAAAFAWCSASADVIGTVTVGLPFYYESMTPSGGFQDPCVSLYADVGGKMGCGPLNLGGGGNIGPFAFGCAGLASPASPMSAAAVPEAVAQLHASPALAANEAGEALAMWVHDEGGSLAGIQPYLYYATYDGRTWSRGARLMPDAAIVDSPQIALLPRNRALAVWTQNRQALPDALAKGDARDFEIYYALWNGERWSTPRMVTDNDRADGRAALAVDPVSGAAMAAWVERIDPVRPGTLPGDFVIYYAMFDGEAWSVPAPITDTANVFDSAVSLRFDAQGTAWAVWVRDTDRDFLTFADRQLLIARWSGGRWETPAVIPDTPAGAFAPSLAVDRLGRPLVAFTVPPTFPDGKPGSGVGNRSTLWAAFHRGRTWEVGRIADGLYAEGPVVEASADDQAIVMFRGFAPDGSVHKDGDLATAVANLGATRLQWGTEYLTDDGQTNWQTAFALAPGSRRQFVVNVKQDPRSNAYTAPQTRMRFAGQSVVTRAVATAAAAPVVALMDMPYQPDLVVVPADVSVSDPHPLAGDTVRITATLRNRGHEAAGAFVVDFVEPSSGTRIGRLPVAGPLPIGVGIPLSVDYTVREGGLHTVQVLVDAGGAVAESNEENNRAELTFGQPPVPVHPVAMRLPVRGRSTLTLRWEAPEGRGIEGYRVYRSTMAGSGYELVGETTQTSFVDALGDDMTAYHYVVSTVDAAGVRSTFSTETSVRAAAPCRGDCDGSRDVTIDELLLMVNIALGTRPAANCVAGDVDGDSAVTVDEIIRAVGVALAGCPAVPAA